MTQSILPIKKVARGGLLGFEDTFGGRNYTSSARCVSHKGIIFKIDAEIFKSVCRDKPQIKNGLRRMSKENDIDFIEKIIKARDINETIS